MNFKITPLMAVLALNLGLIAVALFLVASTGSLLGFLVLLFLFTPVVKI